MASPDPVVVVGASGFGRECLDVLEAMVAAGSPLLVAGVVDDAPSQVNLERLRARGVAHLGSLEQWLASREPATRYVLGVGSPPVRRRLVQRLTDAGALPLAAAVHPSAVLGSVVELGEGVVVCAGAVISTNVRLGRHVHVNPNATIGHDAALGDFVSVNPAAVVSGEATVGEGTLVGAAATILQGLSVGPRSILGAGSLVLGDVPGHVVAYGSPCRAIRPYSSGDDPA